MVNLRINGIPVSVEEGTTILEAAKKVGIKIPTLCHLKEVNEIGPCRICVVEVKGARSHVASCVFPVSEGMEVSTNTNSIRKARKTTLELILSDHRKDCLSCARNLNCELQSLSQEYGCDALRFIGETNHFLPDNSTDYLVRDNTKCILCRKCEAVCKKVQEVAVIGANGRGFKTHIGCAFEGDLKNSPCVACGQCINVCPTGALHEREEIDNVLDAINNPDKIVIVAAAPSVRAGLAEEFGYPIGTNAEGKMASALKMLGFDKVFDVNFAADMTIIEEANELLERINNGGRLPMFTSCSPGWVRYLEFYYPEMIPNLSSCKSPQQMFGALTKTYYAEKMGIDAKNIYTVSIMPCTAKKFEKLRDDEKASGYPDVDAVLTTRELGKLIKRSGIIFDELPNGTFDNPMGEFTGAGVIFGATGGVMEAALRTAVEKITGKEMENLDYKEVRGTNGIKEATYNVGGLDIKVAVASGLSNAKIICDKIRKGECDYHFVEIMCCPGGCVNGGGQPLVTSYERSNKDVKKLRAKVLYDEDANMTKRKSHDNPIVKDVYENYLEEAGSHKAHHILHTTYVKRNKY
jgi:NADP-reducing hydrogenase subunit HndD